MRVSPRAAQHGAATLGLALAGIDLVSYVKGWTLLVPELHSLAVGITVIAATYGLLAQYIDRLIGLARSVERARRPTTTTPAADAGEVVSITSKRTSPRR